MAGKAYFLSALFVLSVFVSLAGASAQAEKAVPGSREQITLSFSPLVKKVAPAVVSISSTRVVTQNYRHPFMDDPFFAPFFGGDFFGRGGLSRQRVEAALGSGVIVQSDGLVVTNAHVIKGADEVKVVLADGREFDSEVVVVDEPSDLALLRMDAKGQKFAYVPIKPSENLEVGDLVLAIGNPFGVGQTVTSGIVSALARPNLNINDYNFFIQTDAAINPGNSGGPLVSMDGSIVGINTAIYSRSGGSLGIGFAIPSEMVATVLAAEKAGLTGERGIARAWLGIVAQQITPDLAETLDLATPQGVLIADLQEGSPLQGAGLKPGDVIIEIGGREVRDPAEMKFRWAQVPIGKTTAMTFLRNGERKTAHVKASLPPDEPPRNETTLSGRHPLQGATIANVNPAVAFELGLREESGVVVTKVDPRSPAVRLVQRGDVIVEINDLSVKNVKDAARILDRGGYSIDLVLSRGGQVRRVMLR
ncbi:MAG: Do family serine endopeptidase [Alphaproteobacteria bacterium]|nr:Do family serine endopeptidase [Alphaproteobacteria bacterium]